MPVLFESTDITLWEAVLEQYQEALEHHLAGKKDDTLLALDEWYQTTLPELLSQRKPTQFIDSNELCQLMSWKLKRGKFRPSLAKLAASNADVDVKRISQDAFKLVSSNLKAAITKMAELKGVGPATASAILCAGAPDGVPFMADETMDSVPGLGTIAYTIPYYLKFATKVIDKASQLKAKGSKTVNTPHLVEKALWVDYMLEKYGVKRKASSSTSSTSLKRKAETPGKEQTDKAKDKKTAPAASAPAPGKKAKTTSPPKPASSSTSTRTTRSRSSA